MDIEIIVVNSTSEEDFAQLYELVYAKCPFFKIFPINEPFEGIIIGYSMGVWTAKNHNNPNYNGNEIMEYFDSLLESIPKKIGKKVCYVNYSTFASIPSYFAWVYSKNGKEDFDEDIYEAFSQIGIKINENIFRYLEEDFYKFLN